MYPWIRCTLHFWLQFCEKKCGLHMDVYDTQHSLEKSRTFQLQTETIWYTRKQNVRSRRPRNSHFLCQSRRQRRAHKQRLREKVLHLQKKESCTAHSNGNGGCYINGRDSKAYSKVTVSERVFELKREYHTSKHNPNFLE